MRRLGLMIGCVAVTAWMPGCKASKADDRPRPALQSPSDAGRGRCGPHASGQLFCEGKELKLCRDGQVHTHATCSSIERCDSAKNECVPDCPAGEVYIPPTGPEGFVMGRGKHRNGRDKPHTVVLTKAFCMDETEVTAGAYAVCVQSGRCEEPGKWDPFATYPRFPDHPINMVDWKQAKHYCELLGKSLPTEAQWEWAASGGRQQDWPWGDHMPSCADNLLDFTPGGAPKWAPGGDVGCRGGGTSPVKSFAGGAAVWPSGKLFDIVGNVWEWTLDLAVPYSPEPQTDPVVLKAANPATIVRVVRGGAWNRSALGCTTWFRGEAVEGYRVPGLGFRCVRLSS